MLPITPYNEVYDTRHGKMCAFKSDVFMGRGLRELGECDENESQLLCSLVGPGDVAIDVGANIGIHAVPLARKVGNSGLVLAFEPQQIVFLNLCANAAINSLFAMRPINAAVGYEHGSVSIAQLNPWTSENTGLYSIPLHKDKKGIPVQVVTLDDYDHLRVKLIKIDVEGMEPAVFRGARNLITKHRPYIYSECFSAEAAQEQGNVIRDMPYTGYICIGSVWSENNWNGCKVNNFVDVHSPNVLWVPEGKPVPSGVGDLIVKTGLVV